MSNNSRARTSEPGTKKEGNAKMAQKLRFAPLIRVSTERQEKQSESLLSQKTRIKDYVKYLGGTIPEYAWKYCGQEHSTPGYERKLFDQMIEDCSKDLFDAIIVDDVYHQGKPH